MIKIENVEIIGWKAAIRGMRNPMNSWYRSDSFLCKNMSDMSDNCSTCEARHIEQCYNGFVLGYNDYKLMMNLAEGGPVHAKYRRMIVVYLDITAPLYWWKEFDTYRTGVTPNPMDIEMNSCSTMHKVTSKEFTLEDFSHEHLVLPAKATIDKSIEDLNFYRSLYFQFDKQPDSVKEVFGNDKKNVWWQIIQLLPSSYNQRRTVMLNYEVLAGIYQSRKDHKLDEWREFCKWIENLPLSNIITLKGE